MGGIASGIGSLFGGSSAASGLSGVTSALGSLLGGGGGSTSSGGGTSGGAQPSDGSIDTPGAVQQPDQSLLADPTVQEQVAMASPGTPAGQDPAATVGGAQSGVQDPEIKARQGQQPAQPARQDQPPSQSDLTQLAQAVNTNPWQLGAQPRLGAVQGINPLTQNLTNLAAQMRVPAGPSGPVQSIPPTATTPIQVSALPPAPTVGGRGGGAYGQISGAAMPDVAAAINRQTAAAPTAAVPAAAPTPVTAGGRGGIPGYGQAPSSLAQTAAAVQAQKSAQATNFAGQDHDPTIPRSGNPGLDQVKSRIAAIDTGNAPHGGYHAVGQPVINRRGVRGRGIGKYQIMSYNVGPWTERFLGQRMTPQQFLNNPHAQDRLANAVLHHLYRQYGNWQDVASVWVSGVPARQAGRGPDAARVRQFERRIAG